MTPFIVALATCLVGQVLVGVLLGLRLEPGVQTNCIIAGAMAVVFVASVGSLVAVQAVV